MPWGLWSCLASLKRGKTVEHALGTVVLSGFSEEGAELYNMPWGLWSCLSSLKMGKTVEHALGTVFLSGFSEEGAEL